MADDPQVQPERSRLPPVGRGDVVMMAHAGGMMAWLFAVILTWGDADADPLPTLALVFGAWLVTVPVAWLVAGLLDRSRAARHASSIQGGPAVQA